MDENNNRNDRCPIAHEAPADALRTGFGLILAAVLVLTNDT
jgi:hypothetical protein